MPLIPVPVPRRFQDRSVVVTGAGTGFGAEIAVRAAQEGARAVGVHYRNSVEGAKRTAGRVAAHGSTPVLFQADIVDWEQIKALADAAFDRLDGVDVLVNNVGDVAREQMSWRDITEESIDHVLGVDIKGTMLCVHEFGARMLEQGHGAIVNIGSTVVVRGSARAPQYAADKYGLLGLTKSYAHAFAPTVRVNVFAPGFIETEATLGRKDWQSGRGDQLRSLTPMGRIPGPAELAGPALFVAGVGRICGAVVAGLMFSAAGLFVTFLNLHLNVGKYQAIVAGLALVLTAVQNPDGLTSTSTGKGPAVAVAKLRDRAVAEYRKRQPGQAAGGPNVEGDERDLHHPVG